MQKILFLGLIVLMSVASGSAQEQSGSAQPRLMNKTEFDLFLHDLERDSVRWMNMGSEVDVSSLKDLPYRKGQLMEKAKNRLHKNLSAIQDDVGSLRKAVTLTSQLDLLLDLEETASSMDDLGNDLDFENSADLDKVSSWLSDAGKASGEILDAVVKLYGHLRELSRHIDRQIDVGRIH